MDSERENGFGRRSFLLSAGALAATPLLAGAASQVSPRGTAPSETPAATGIGRRRLGSLEVSSLGLGVQNISRTYQTTIPAASPISSSWRASATSPRPAASPASLAHASMYAVISVGRWTSAAETIWRRTNGPAALVAPSAPSVTDFGAQVVRTIQKRRRPRSVGFPRGIAAFEVGETGFEPATPWSRSVAWSMVPSCHAAHWLLLMRNHWGRARTCPAHRAHGAYEEPRGFRRHSGAGSAYHKQKTTTGAASTSHL
jgi:hypothetical protein